MQANYYLSVAFVYIILSNTLAKPPVVIEPKNPNAPTKLPDGVTKKALVIGKDKKTFN